MLSSVQAFAYSHKKIIEIYESGDYQEKTFAEVKLSAAKKESILKNLDSAGEHLSNIWGDTVLEGPYSQLGPSAIVKDYIQALYYKNQLIGFVGHVQAEAAYTDSCDYNDELSEEQAEREFNECLQDYRGVISESFLADKDGEYIDGYIVSPADFED